MATLITEPPAQPEPSVTDIDEEKVDMVLVDRIPESWRLSRGGLFLIFALSVFFWRLSTRPLFHTDLWGHLAYGRWIWEHGTLPATEPLLPLAKGVPLVDTAWLSQLLGYGIISLSGPVGLQFVMALSVTAMLGIIGWSVQRRTQSSLIAGLGMAACLWLSIQQLCIGWGEMPMLIRPQVVGVVFYTWMFCAAASRAPTRLDCIIIPALTCFWANLHGSFVMGPLLLGLISVGRALDIYRRTGSWKAVWRDRRALPWFLIAELSAAAALVNPYGVGLYAEVLTFTRHPNLTDLLDWEPLTLRSFQGRAVAAVGCVMAMIYRLSPRRVSLSEYLILVGLGLWTMWTSRMLIWWSIPAAYYLAIHTHAVARRQRRGVVVTPPTRTGLCTVAAVGAIWMGFALSPFGIWVMHRKVPPLKSTVSADTPVAAVEYLHKLKELPRGQIFNSYEWGDYLAWAGPRQLPLFVDSHVHIIPREVWQSYLTISRAANNWDDQLEKYGVNCVVIDHRRLTGLSSQLKANADWRLAYEDGIAAIFIRRNPI